MAKASSEGGSAAASKNVVTPCLRSASSAACAALTLSAGVGAGISLATGSCAASSRIPDGLPDGIAADLAAQRIGVCGGRCPRARRARELTSAVWPNDDSTKIGRWVFSASRVARLVDRAGRQHALLKPIHDLEPAVRLERARLIEAGLDLRLHLLDVSCS